MRDSEAHLYQAAKTPQIGEPSLIPPDYYEKDNSETVNLTADESGMICGSLNCDGYYYRSNTEERKKFSLLDLTWVDESGKNGRDITPIILAGDYHSLIERICSYKLKLLEPQEIEALRKEITTMHNTTWDTEWIK